MQIDQQTQLFLLGLLATVLGFFIRRLISDSDRLRKDFETEKRYKDTEIASIRENFTRYNEFSRFQITIEEKLSQIYDILVDRQ